MPQPPKQPKQSSTQSVGMRRLALWSFAPDRDEVDRLLGDPAALPDAKEGNQSWQQTSRSSPRRG